MIERRQHHEAPRARSSQRGMTLIEALMAMAILSIVLTGFIPSLIVYAQVNNRNEVRTGAVQASQIVMEGLRRQDPETMPGPTPTYTRETVDVGDRLYEVVTRYCRVATYCSDESRHILLEVSHDGNLVYTTETVFTQIQ